MKTESRRSFAKTMRVLACVLGLGVVLAACAHPVLSTPDGYIEIDDDHYSARHATWKAMSPDGAVLLVRVQDDLPVASLESWAEALSTELGNGRAYELLETNDVRSSSGFDGKWMKFRGNIDEQIYRYDVAVFIWEDDSIITVESAVPEDLYEQHQEALGSAIRSMRIE